MHWSYWHIQARTANSIIWAPTRSPPSTFPEAGLPWTTRGWLPATHDTPALPCAADGSREMRFREDANKPFGDVLNLALFTVISMQLTSLFNSLKWHQKAIKPFGLEVGGFLLSWSVLPSEDSVGNKAVGRVGRMTSHLGQAHGWTLLLPHLGPLNGPRQDPGKHPGVLKTPRHYPWNYWRSLSCSQIISVLFYHLLGICFSSCFKW